MSPIVNVCLAGVRLCDDYVPKKERKKERTDLWHWEIKLDIIYFNVFQPMKRILPVHLAK